MTKVLIVEDEAIIARDIQDRLQKLGYAVLNIAYSPGEALKIISDMHPDIVLMDIMLQHNENSIDTARQIRENYYIPVIYLTAYSDDNTLQQAKITEPFGYLLKPFDERELHTTIQMALYKHKIEKKLKQNEKWLNTTLRSISDIVIATDTVGHITFFNSSAEKITGWKQDEIRGKDIVKLLHLHDNINPVLEVFNQQGVVEIHGDAELITMTGAAVCIDGSASPIIDERGINIGVILVLRNITENKATDAKLKQSYGKLQNSLEGTIKAMAMIVEIRDPYTAGHQNRVAELACLLAREMGFAENQITGLSLASTIHDLGKIYVPAEILSKTGKLNEIEFSMIRTHPRVGYDILKGIEFPWPIARMVYEHHERLDGSGYPNGLKKEKILPESCVLMVSDVVEAMSSYRPYRPAKGLPEAMDEISQNKGVLYDPLVVDACAKLYRLDKLDFLKEK